MPSRVPPAVPLLALAALAASACFSPGDPRPLRYYRVEEPLAAPAAGDPAQVGPALRARHASAAGHLRERLAVRSSPVRVELLELERWTEPPLAYVQRALERELFETGRLRRTEALDAPALDIALRAFEAVQGASPGGPVAEVAFVVALHAADGAALLERVIAAREPLEGEGPEAQARALSAALDMATKEAADAILRALREETETRNSDATA